MCAICNFKIEFDIGHPQALTVAVATRAAIEAEMLPEQVFDGPLGHAKLRLTAIDTLKDFQNRLEAVALPAELRALPDFYVLLIESGTWGFFSATEDGFDPDIEPDLPNVTAELQSDRDIVLVAAQATMRAVLGGSLTLSQALADNLIVLDAESIDSRSLFIVMDKAFPEEVAHHSVVT